VRDAIQLFISVATGMIDMKKDLSSTKMIQAIPSSQINGFVKDAYPFIPNILP
jgi:hypothetical protein